MGQYNPTTLRELVYTEFALVRPYNPFPFTEEHLEDKFSKFQTGMFKLATTTNGFKYNWEDFLKHCMIEITIMDNDNSGFTSKVTKIVSGRRYALPHDLITAINEHTPNGLTSFEATAQIKIYNIVSNTVPTPTRLLGYNHYYQSMLGGGNMGTRNNHLVTADGSISESHSKTLIRASYLKLWDIDINPADYDANPLDYDACVWMQTNKGKNLFSLPPIGEKVTITTGNRWSISSRRKALDIEGGGYTPIVPGNLEQFSIVKSAVCFIQQAVGQQVNVNWVEKPMKATVRGTDDYSFLMVYGIQCGYSRAIYIKPFGGIDTLCVGRFDPNRYRLEAVYSSPIGGHRPRYRYISEDINKDNVGTGTYTSRLLRRHFFQGGKYRNTDRGLKNKDNAWEIHYYLRGLDTDFVSSISKSYVKALLNMNKASGIDFLIGFKV